MSPRTLVLGDIHGCSTALDEVLKHVNPQPGDLVISLGDVVDRGPGSMECIDMLIRLSLSNELVVIRGNHEEMMLNAMSGGMMESSWLRYGGKETMESYGGRYDLIPPNHVDFLSSTVRYWEDDRNICVHASIDPELSLKDQKSDTLRWSRFTGEEEPLEDGRRVICGHTVQTHGLPALRNSWICIDTYAYGGQFLTCLDLTNDLVYQTRQDRGFRGPAPLDEVALKI